MIDRSLPARQPSSVWFLHSDKAGDNGQVETVIAALGWQVQRKFLAMREQYVWGKPWFRASIKHLDPSRSDPLEPPWPDLIFTVGRRPSMAALWVRQQSAGHTRVVLIGKPTGQLMSFELVVASAENQLPPLRNFLPIQLPLMRIDQASIEEAAGDWRDRLQSLPRPLIGILIGGPTSPYCMDSEVANGLIRESQRIIAMGGTPYLTTSRRTPNAVVEQLRENLPEQARLFAWSSAATDNPYKALLGLGDGYIVTGDSISMMVEVMRLGKALQIFTLPFARWGAVDQYRRNLAHCLFRPHQETTGGRLRHSFGRLIYRLDAFKLLCATRNFREFHRMLVKNGLAQWSGAEFQLPSSQPQDDIDRVVQRIGAISTTSVVTGTGAS